MFIALSKPIVSTSESTYRHELFPDVREIKNINLLCTSCGISVKDLIITKGKPIVHPFLETLLCKKCHVFYGDGLYPVDEDGSDKYCRWCGQGGTLFLCSKCSSGFCKRCIKRNLPKSAQAKIEDDNWVCFFCDISPLYELRAQCWAAQQYAAEYVKNKGSPKIKKGSKDSSKRSRESDRSEADESVPNKKKRKGELKGKKEKTNKGDEKEDSGESEDQTGNSGLSLNRIQTALDKLTDFVADIAGMTKETHKKLLECKNKKINLKNINSTESVVYTHKKINNLLVTLESNARIVREGLEAYVEQWCKDIKKHFKSKEKTVFPPKSKDIEVSKEIGEEKNPESDKKKNDDEEKIPQVADKGQEESLEEYRGDSVVEEGKVSSEVGNQALSAAETTTTSNDNDPPGEEWDWMEWII